jgi:hypothetical protein
VPTHCARAVALVSHPASLTPALSTTRAPLLCACVSTVNSLAPLAKHTNIWQDRMQCADSVPHEAVPLLDEPMTRLCGVGKQAMRTMHIRAGSVFHATVVS